MSTKPKHSAPIAVPDPSCCQVPARPPGLPAESSDAIKYRTILAHFCRKDLQLAVKDDDVSLRSLDDWEKMFLSEEMINRYLKATKGKVAEAITRLESTLVWRRTLGMYDVEGQAKELEPEFESGKIAIIGYTRQAQPILYTWTSKNEQPSSFRQVKHIMFCMERVIDLQTAGVQGVMFCADISGKTQTQPGAMGVTRQILNYLQSHYPERLGGAAMLKMPWLGSLFVTLIWPFIDSDTRKKIYVNPDLSKDLVAPEQLLDTYGGAIEFEWTQEYLPSLVNLCVERRNANLQRWKAKGSQVGMSEWDFLEPMPSASHPIPTSISTTLADEKNLASDITTERAPTTVL